MQAAAKVGISINISQVGSVSLKTGASASRSPVDGAKEWNPSFMLDEDGLLYQLRAALVQTRDGCALMLFLLIYLFFELRTVFLKYLSCPNVAESAFDHFLIMA